jgi:hypothetical protein
MMRRVDGKESILGDLENVSNGSVVEALWAFGPPEPKKRLKQPDGGFECGGKGAENSSQRRRFLPPFQRSEGYVTVRDNYSSEPS